MAISTIGTNGIEDGAIVAADIASGAVTQVKVATGVSGTGPAFAAYHNSTQSGVSGTTWTKVLFDTEFFDTNNNFASSRFTPTVAGYYQLNASNYNQLNNTTDGLYIRFYKNGSNYGFGTSSVGNSNNYAGVSTSTVVYLNGSTDYVEVYCFNNPNATNFYQGSFSGSMVRAA